MPRFGTWLAETRRLQADAYDAIPARMGDEELVDYVRFNFLASHTELSEALQSLLWKRYHGQVPARPRGERRTRVATELVDVLHHVGNLLVALGIDDGELNALYESKSQLNRRRQEEAARV